MSDLAATPAPEVQTKKQSPSELSLGTKVAAGTGESCINIGINMPKEFAFVVYNLTMGVNAILLSFVLMLPRIWDALTDPIMGSISDNTRSRWGRRKPYMLLGGFLSAILLALICIPPSFLKGWFAPEESWELFGWSFTKVDWLASAYLLVISLLFYTALTVFSVPYGALTMEMTSDYNERTRLMSFRTTFTYLSGMITGWILYMTKWDIWVDLAKDAGAADPVKQGEVYGTWAVGGMMTLILLGAALIPTFFIKERMVSLKKLADEQNKKVRELKKTPLLQTLVETLSMPSFVLIVLAYTIAFFGIIMVIHLGLYINIYYTHDGDKKLGYLAQGWANTFKPMIGLGTVFILNRIANRVEKKLAWAVCLGVSLLGAVLTWFLYSPELEAWKPSIFGIEFYLHPLIIPFGLLFPGLAATLMMSYSMIADVCDIDEIKSGTRREGMYWAVFNWVQKLAISGALLMTGFTLSFSLFDQNADKQTAETIETMRQLFTFTLVISITIALVMVLSIPLSKSRMQAVRDELQARHAAEDAQA
jgi:GPH family glycoside/pentoside/hexuronide:cation symporter